MFFSWWLSGGVSQHAVSWTSPSDEGLKFYLTIRDCLGFQFSLMEVSCVFLFFPCQNVVPSRSSPVKTTRQRDLSRDGKTEVGERQRKKLWQRESNKNTVDLWRIGRGESKRENNDVVHSKGIWRCLPLSVFCEPSFFFVFKYELIWTCMPAAHCEEPYY